MKQKPQDYSPFDHRHRFAAWAAARAAGRGFPAKLLKRKYLDEIRRLLDPGSARRDWPSDGPAFVQLHRKWCEGLCRRWVSDGAKPVQATFGRAAKFINIYLKAMLTVGPKSKLTRLVHPPIDRLLLLAFRDELSRRNMQLPPPLASKRFPAWTQMEAEAYEAIIEAMQAFLKEQDQKAALWQIEYLWDPER